MLRSVFTLFFLALPALAEAPCAPVTFDAAPYTVCTIDPAIADVSLHHTDASGEIIGQPVRLEAQMAAAGRRMLLATNAGMYHADRAPVGLLVIEGEERAPLVRGDGPGNFQLLPNGVFWMADGGAYVTETEAYHTAAPTPEIATQSGPMLVIDGALHPAFREGSESVFRRNGVGVDGQGRVVIAISETPVNLHSFARFFRDHLGSDNALYLDGKISRLIIPGEDRYEFGLNMGPILAVSIELAPDHTSGEAAPN